MSRRQAASLTLLAVALLTLPLWIARVGLYQYLGIEILVWGLYAMSFNLLLGYTGLPSFGHGAYFGVVCCKNTSAPTFGWTSAAPCSPRPCAARWWLRSSRTGAASTTR